MSPPPPPPRGRAPPCPRPGARRHVGTARLHGGTLRRRRRFAFAKVNAAADEGKGGAPEGARREGGLALADAPESVWAAKPLWCQPATIVASGIGVVAGVEALAHAWWLTGPAVVGVGAWWYLFLGVYSMQYKDLLAAARQGDAAAERYILSLLDSFGYTPGGRVV